MLRQCLPAKEAPPGSWGPIAPHAHCRNLTTAAFLKYLVCGLIGSWALPINPVEASLNCRSFFFFPPVYFPWPRFPWGQLCPGLDLVN